MSFPKAKLTRFNDITDSTPSPADYNPVDVKSRATGGVIAGKDRFGEDKLENVSIQSGSSSRFRTPTPIKKSKSHASTKSKTDDSEALKEKLVECSNKDLYIKELADQINELEGQITDIKSQREIVIKDCAEFQEELYFTEEQHIIAIKVLLLCYDVDKRKINEEISDLTSELDELQNKHNLMRKHFEEQLGILTKTMSEYDERFQTAVRHYCNELKAKDAEIVIKQDELQLSGVKLRALDYAHNMSLENVYNIRRKSMDKLQKKMRLKIVKVQQTYFSELDDKDEDVRELQKEYIEKVDHQIETPEVREVAIKSKTLKEKTNNLNMYTEIYDNDNLEAVDNTEGLHAVVTSFKHEQQINPNLKMKFYPIENIEDVGDSEGSTEFEVASFSIDSNDESYVPMTKINSEEKDVCEEPQIIPLKPPTSHTDCTSTSNIDTLWGSRASEVSFESLDANQITTEMMKGDFSYLNELEDNFEKFCVKCEDEAGKVKDKEVQTLIDSHETQIISIKEEHTFYIQQIKENSSESVELAKIQAEEELKDADLTWRLRLDAKAKEDQAVFEECQAIGEYTIGQSQDEQEELEIRIVDEELEAKKWNENRRKYEQLMGDYAYSLTEFKMLEEKLLHEITLLDDEKKQYKNDNFTYRVTIDKVHETIETLSRRLFESDNDVEQLKAELKECDTSKLQLQDKKKQLAAELNTLTKLNEDFENQQESSVKVFENEIKLFEENILQTVETCTSDVSKVINNYKTKLETAEFDVRDLAQCLYDQEVLNSEAYNLIHLANIEIEDLDKNNRHLDEQLCTVKIKLAQSNSQIDHLIATKQQIEEKLRYEQLQNAQLQEDLEKAKLRIEETDILSKQINQLQEKNNSYYQYGEYYRNKANEYEKEIDEMNNINKCYIDQSKKYEDLLQKCEAMEAENSELQKLVAENEKLVGPFRKQLEAYEHERQTLLSQKCDAENEARVVGLRYAEMLGHQNQKQKIKHIVDLKEKNLNLFKSSQVLDVKILAQSNTIEKLKAELALYSKTPKKVLEANKENVTHENYASPLRDRNQC